MGAEDIGSSLSRRRMLKTVGAGAAVAWTAPALISVGGAVAGASPVCNGGTCGDQEACGDICTCLLTAEGGGHCHQPSSCGVLQACTQTSDCPAGWACANSCCGGLHCIPPCGVAAGADDGGPSTKG